MSSFAEFKVLTFDIIGTCINFERVVLESIRSVAGDKANQLTDDEIFEHYREGRTRFGGRVSEVWRDVLLYTSAQLGLRDDVAAGDFFAEQLFKAPPFDDSVEALRRLRRRFRLVAMTNYDRVAFSANAHALGDPFHDSVTYDDVGVAKPDPQFFAYNLGRQSAFGFKKHEILHVAQSQYHDMEPGRALGYKICWIERRKGKIGYGAHPAPSRLIKPDFHFTSLAELVDAIESDNG